MAGSNPQVKVVRVETRTTYPEGNAPGGVVETQVFDHPILGPLVCRVRSSDGENIQTLELSQPTLSKLGINFKYYRNRGVHKLLIDQEEE